MAIAAALLGAAPVAHAQLDVRGMVFDSTLSRGGLSGAEVLVLGTSRTAMTDAQGRFVLRGLPAGTHEIVAMHPLLDTLGFDELSLDVTVGSTTPEITFATPSLARYSAERCGRALAAHEGIVIGAVRGSDGAEEAGVVVRAMWAERRVAKGDSEQKAREVVDTTDESGRYAVCGVPREPAIMEDATGATARSVATFLATASDGRATGRLTRAALEQPLMRHDLVVAVAGAVAEVRGRVLDEEGKPLVGARVTRTGAASVTTDSSGRFTIAGVPQRSEQLLLRAVGHEPAILELSPLDARFDAGDVRLARTVFTLGTVNVTAGAMSPQRTAFEERRKLGMGSFLDDEELRKQPKVTAAYVASRVHGARMVNKGLGEYTFGFERIRLQMDSTHCTPRYFIDGQDYGVLSNREVDFYFSLAVRLEAYSAAKAPPQYNDFDGCGVVLIWTR